jgi:hypothetical protein
MPGRYATQTDVPAWGTRNEIERLIEKYGGSRIVWSLEPTLATLIFEMKGWRIRYDLPLPAQNSRDFTMTEGGRRRTSQNTIKLAWEQGVRARWRALKLVLQANLEAVELGIISMERAFLGNVMLSSGETVADRVIPELRQITETGRMPALLPAPREE